MNTLEDKNNTSFLGKILAKLQNNETKTILFLLFIAFFVRIVFSLLFPTGHPTDINNFRIWSMDVTKKGIFDFFQPSPVGTWCDYPPGYIWVLYLTGKIYSFIDPTFANWSGSLFTTFTKFPGILAEIINIYLIYFISRRYVPSSIAIGAATIYAFQPAMFYESAVWGQMDSVTVTFLMLTLLFMIDKKFDLAILVTAINCMMKPQGILLIPLLAFVGLYNLVISNDKSKLLRQAILGLLYGIGYVYLITLPITKDLTQVIPWLYQHYVAQADLYPFSSIQAFNLWALTGMWQKDSREILGISHKFWGMLFYLSGYAFACYYYVIKSRKEKESIETHKTLLEKELLRAEDNLDNIKKEKYLEIENLNYKIDSFNNNNEIPETEKQDNVIELESLKNNTEKQIKEAETKITNLKDTLVNSAKNFEGVALIHASTIALISFFIFPTRMHERYLFPGLSFLAISAAMNFRIKNMYYVLSGIFLINLFFEFPGDKSNIGAPPFMTALVNLLKTPITFMTAQDNFGLFFFTPLVLANIYLVFLIFMKLWKEKPVEVDENEILNQTQNIIKSESNDTKKGFTLPPISKFDLKDLGYILGISLVSFISRFLFLDFPEEMIFDEVYHARAGGEYIMGVHPFEWVHPPLAKILIGVGEYIFGVNAFGWRIMPVIFGTLFIPIMYIFGKSLFNRREAGILAALILAMDGVFFVQSRTAMTNIFATFFQVSAVAFFWFYVQYDYWKEKAIKKYTFFAISGVFMSLALATRWTSMGALAFILGSMIWYRFLFDITLDDILKGNLKPFFNKINFEQVKFLFMALVFFVLLPYVVYIIAYIPYMKLNHNVADIWDMQKGIYTYHKNLRDPHPYYSEWYTWPFLIRPTWYYFRDFHNGTLSGIIAIGNPAIWWSSIFVTLFALYKAIREKHASLLYSGLGFVILYLPWAVSPRIKNFNHYLFEAIPYACLSLAFVIMYLWDKGNEKKEELSKEDITFNRLSIFSVVILALSLIFIGLLALWTQQWKYANPFPFLEPYTRQMFDSVGYLALSLVAIIFYALWENNKFRTISVLYFSIIVALFIFFYPLFSGYPMNWAYYSIHIWMKSWI
ncbi:MAG: phospholipid carrier-dependent glycosyltransferase [Candidatus Sericytochromatia bacterium]